MGMTLKQLREHQTSGTPYVVYGDPITIDPSLDPGDPHQLYRAWIANGEIAVNVETCENYDRLKRLCADAEWLQRKVTALKQELTELAGRL